MLEVSRKYGIPERTLYQKMEKLKKQNENDIDEVEDNSENEKSLMIDYDEGTFGKDCI